MIAINGKISLVLPMYNEEKIAEDTVKAVKEYMEKNFAGDYEIIIVNDGSSDGTLRKMEKYKSENIRVVSYEKNMGKGHAVRQGILAAKNDYIMYTDSDLAYGLDVILECAEMLEKNPEADLVIGSRKLHKDGYQSYTFIRKVTSKTFIFLLKTVGGIKTSDSQSGFKGFKREAARKIFSNCEENRWSFDFEAILIAQKLKMTIKEMPVKIINHRESESKINLLKDGAKMFRDIKRIKKNVKNKDISQFNFL